MTVSLLLRVRRTKVCRGVIAQVTALSVHRLAQDVDIVELVSFVVHRESALPCAIAGSQ
jgi:hypothetical protein